jgi:hypothetical protein
MAAKFATDRGKRGSDVMPALFDLTMVRCTVIDEGIGEKPLGQADCTKLHTACLDWISALAHEEFGTSTADINQKNSLFEHRERLEYTEMDQSCFLETTDHFDLDTDLVSRPIEELVSIRCLTDGARRHSREIDVTEARGHLFHPAQGRNATFDSIWCEELHFSAALAEPDGLLLTREHFEPTVAGEPGHDEVHRIGPDIDGRLDRRGRRILHGLRRRLRELQPTRSTR